MADDLVVRSLRSAEQEEVRRTLARLHRDEPLVDGNWGLSNRARAAEHGKPAGFSPWDITKLLGPAKWTYFYLYVLLDIYSRYVVGWMAAHRESATLAKKLIAESARKQAIEPGQLTVHADRGSSMTSKPVAFLLADLG